MAQETRLYANGITNLFFKIINFTDGNMKLALVTSAYNPDQDSDDYWNDVSGYEASGTGYTAGGKALANVSVDDSGYSDPGFIVTVTADNIFWTGLTATFRYGILYYNTGTPATSPLIAFIDFSGVDLAPSGQTFGIKWNSNGVIQIISSV